MRATTHLPHRRGQAKGRATNYRVVNDGQIRLVKTSKRASGITAGNLETVAGKTRA